MPNGCILDRVRRMCGPVIAPAATRAVKTPGRYKCTIGMIRIATMFATLIIGLIAGPAVSL